MMHEPDKITAEIKPLLIHIICTIVLLSIVIMLLLIMSPYVMPRVENNKSHDTEEETEFIIIEIPAHGIEEIE